MNNEVNVNISLDNRLFEAFIIQSQLSNINVKEIIKLILIREAENILEKYKK